MNFRLSLFACWTLVCSPVLGAVLNSTFVDLGDGTFDDRANIPLALDYFRSIGMTNIIIHRMAEKTAGCTYDTWRAPRGFSETGLNSRIETFLHHAKLRGMTVILGLAMTGTACASVNDYWNKWQAYAKNMTLVYIAETAWRARYPTTLVGYYLPDEPGLLSYYTSNDDYYYTLAQAQAVRAYSNLPISISPFLGYAAQLGYKPDEVGARAKSFLDYTGVNQLLVQDSTGALGVLTTYNAEYTVEQYFEALYRWVGAASLQADTELFNFAAWGTYNWNVYNGSAGSIYRINQQLWAQRYAHSKTSWIAQQHMYATNLLNDRSTAPRLYYEFRALYGYGGRILGYYPPYYYTPPDSRYPDSWSAELSNGRTGSPRHPNDPEWVGFLGSVNVQLDLGGVTRIDFVSAHAMRMASWGIYFPGAIYVRTSKDGYHWTAWVGQAVEENSWVADGEYVLANSTPLNQWGRYIQVYLTQTQQWTFLSEITVSAIK